LESTDYYSGRELIPCQRQTIYRRWDQ